MWEFYFANFNYNHLYKEYEQLTDAFHWPLSESRKLTYRERKHWIKRYVYKLEQEYERMHQLNNSAQVITRSVGQDVTFSGMPYK
jgi:lysyl-tRNA synthetase class II